MKLGQGVILRRFIPLISVLALVSACGSSGAQSGGPLTVPTTATTPATSPGPDTTTPPVSTSTVVTDSTPTTTVPGTPTTAGPTQPRAATITVFFLNDSGEAIPTTRPTTTSAVARAALDALIAGPDAPEHAAGLSTEFPADSLVLGVAVSSGLARVDMSREFEAGGGSASVLGRLAQLVYTLTEFDSIDRVQLLLDGESIEYFSGEGVLVGSPLTRSDFTGAVPIGATHEGSGSSTWDQDDLPIVRIGDPAVHRVVLVAGDDFLNVRDAAGVEGEIIGRLLGGVAVRTTGESATVGSSTWMRISTPAGPGWVNGFYLTRSVAGDDFPDGTDPLAVVAELADRFASGEDFTDLVSKKGLWVAHHDSPIRFQVGEIRGLLADPTTYRWGSNALEPGSPEIQPRTFAEAVAETFVDTYDDPDRQLHVNRAVEGPNGRPVEFAVPTEFGGFPFVVVYDPGDEARYEGLDWMSWLVSLSYEDGALKVVGLTIDQWAP